MAIRAIYSPLPEYPYVEEEHVEIAWSYDKSIEAERQRVRDVKKEGSMLNITPMLEVSGGSDSVIGRSMSAFTVKILHGGIVTNVESIYQGSKVFENSGPHHSLYKLKGNQAKYQSKSLFSKAGRFTHYDFGGKIIPANPPTAFYDWIYMRGLIYTGIGIANIEEYRGFSDIYFNPEKQINSQAHAAALYVALFSLTDIPIRVCYDALKDHELFFSIVSEGY